MDVTGREWAAEHEVDPGLAARLVADRWPRFRGAVMEPLGIGWDNTVFAADREWVFRFPRRAIAVPLVGREVAVLPVLGPRLPLPIPVPEYVAWDGGPDYPWPFWGARMVPGRELAETGLPGDERVQAAAGAGRFLRALHDPALVAEVDLPRDPLRRGDPSSRADLARPRLEALADERVWEPDPDVWALLDGAKDVSPPGGVAVCHGDLHVRHLMVGEDGAAAGVIDWGDTCLADPAIDLALAYGGFDGAARAALLEAYGRPVPAERELTARVLAVFISAALAQYAAAEGRRALLAEALDGITRAVRS